MLGKAVVFSLCLALLWVWETVPATAQSLPDPPPRDRQTVGPFPETEWTDEHRALGMADEKTRRVAQSPEASGWTDEERTLLQLADELDINSSVTQHDCETLILRIGWNCQAVYEWTKHVGTVERARDHGVDLVTVAEGPTSPGANADDALLLSVVDELYQQAVVSDTTWAALIARYDLAETMSVVYTPSSY